MDYSLENLKNLTTPRDFIRLAASEFERADLFFGHGTDNALDDAFHLVSGALCLPPDVSEFYLAAQLSKAECEYLIGLIQERITTALPTAYILGEAWFCGEKYFVDEAVLIPRSPIAELIQDGFAPWLAEEPQRILDMCSGSGCIAIASAKLFPGCKVDAAELDESALLVLSRNIERHRCAGVVRAVQTDLFSNLQGEVYDLIVCNPPYVPEAEWAALPPEYHHEPKLALAAGADGMDIVERVLRESPEHLSENGVLICEVGAATEEFLARFPDAPVIWAELEHGGDGVFIITREELLLWRKNLAPVN